MASIYDVAKLAKVSTATVSAVINGTDKVESKTRRRVLAAIERLHYQPNFYASNLAKSKMRLIGLIVSDILNPFFGEIAQSIRQEAESRGYEISLADTQFSRKELVSAVKRMVGMRVAGLAIMTTEMDSQVLEILRASRVPAVFEDVGTVDRTISNIRIDYEGGIYKAVKYLVDLGHKRILFVRTYPENTTKDDLPLLSISLRTSAFQRVAKQLKQAGIEPQIVSHSGRGPKAGQEAIHKAIQHCKGFTAVIAIADPVALGVLRGLHQRRIRVPEEVSIVGFDNSYLCEYLCPALTSVDIPRSGLGKMVVDCLASNIEFKEPGRELILETNLVVRESATRLGAVPISKRGRST
ncbi:MAG TPA: LacI family DNA-binding transcriptional regulator [Terriglobia bacterium]|nr:LacI family DNA-binding transcriptional regulator [Terriglobia bacterium]